MRRDMHHILSECRAACPREIRKGPGNWPLYKSKEPIRSDCYDRRSLTPLRRWLNRQVGRHWDVILSSVHDICRRRAGSRSSARLRDGLESFLPNDLYIDSDRILRRKVRKLEVEILRPPVVVRTGKLRKLVKEDGIWYVHTGREVPVMTWVSEMYAKLHEIEYHQADMRSLGSVRVPTGKKEIVFTRAKQVGKRELRKFGIRNDPPTGKIKKRKKLKILARHASCTR